MVIHVPQGMARYTISKERQREAHAITKACFSCYFSRDHAIQFTLCCHGHKGQDQCCHVNTYGQSAAMHICGENDTLKYYGHTDTKLWIRDVFICMKRRQDTIVYIVTYGISEMT